MVPGQFYGVGKEGKQNQTVVFRHVDRFIRMRRFESPSLHEVCKGIKVVGSHNLLDAQDLGLTEAVNMYSMAATSQWKTAGEALPVRYVQAYESAS